MIVSTNKNNHEEARPSKGSPPQVMPPNRPSKAEMAVRAIMFVALSWVVAVALKLLQHPLYDSVVHANSPVPLNAAYPYVSFLVAAFAVGVMTRLWDHRPLASLGLRFGTRTWGYLIMGLLTAFVGNALTRWLISAAYLKFPVWPFVTIVPPEDPLSSLGRLIAVAIYEELYFHSYGLQTLITAIGTTPALLTTSAVFGVVHWSGWIEKTSAALFGFVMGALYVKTRSLWMPIGFHFGWNFTSAFIGFPVSGEPTQVRWEVVLASRAFVLSALLALLLVLPLRPHPRDQELWDRYVKPAPCPRGGGPRHPTAHPHNPMRNRRTQEFERTDRPPPKAHQTVRIRPQDRISSSRVITATSSPSASPITRAVATITAS